MFSAQILHYTVFNSLLYYSLGELHFVLRSTNFEPWCPSKSVVNFVN